MAPAPNPNRLSSCVGNFDPAERDVGHALCGPVAIRGAKRGARNSLEPSPPWTVGLIVNDQDPRHGSRILKRGPIALLVE